MAGLAAGVGVTVKRYCQTCGRRAVYRSVASGSDSRYRSDDRHDLCVRCSAKAGEAISVGIRESDIVKRQIEQMWVEHEMERRNR